MLTSVGCPIETKSTVKKYQSLTHINLVKTMVFNIKIADELLLSGHLGARGQHVLSLVVVVQLREVVCVRGQTAQKLQKRIVYAMENLVKLNHAQMIVARLGTSS